METESYIGLGLTLLAIAGLALWSFTSSYHRLARHRYKVALRKWRRENVGG